MRVRTRRAQLLYYVSRLYQDLKRLEFPAWTQRTLTITRTITHILLLRMFIHFITPGTFYLSLPPRNHRTSSFIPHLISTSSHFPDDTFHRDRDVTLPNPQDRLAAVLRGRVIISMTYTGEQ